MAGVYESGVVLIKLGGSCITRKNSFETLNEEGLESVVNSIAKCWRLQMPLVLIHGAGSFGHFQAKHYSLNDPNLKSTTVMEPFSEQSSAFKDMDWRVGFVETAFSVRKLHNEVVTRLLRVGVPAVSIHPFPSFDMNGSQLGESSVHQVVNVLKSGLVPVLHGDVVLNKAAGRPCSVLSGDQIMSSLAASINFSRVVFATDVDGVYSSPPGTEGSKLLRELSPGKDDGEYSDGVSHDVTGGMARKVKDAKAIAEIGSTCVMVVKGESNDFDAAIQGKPTEKGTFIRKHNA